MDPQEQLDEIRRIVGPLKLDIAVHVDGELTVSDNLAPQIAQLEQARLRLKAGADALRAAISAQPIP